MTDTVTTLKLDEIKTRDDFNPRSVVEPDADLIKSIEEHGLIQPVTVVASNGHYELVAGERRYLASLMAEGVDEIPVFVRERRTDNEGEDLVVAIIENMKRRDLTIVEEARASARLRELGYSTAKMIATALSIPQARVKRYDQLLSLPVDVQDMIHAGEVHESAIEVLAPIAKASQEICSRVVAHACAANYSVGDVAKRWPTLLEESYQDEIERDRDENTGEFPENYTPPARQFYVSTGHYEPWDFDIDEKVAAKITEAQEISPWGVTLRFEKADLDAARAYGCTIEFEPPKAENAYMQGRAATIITDREWASDRVASTIAPRLLKKARKDKKERDKRDAEWKASGSTAERKKTVAEEAAERGVEESVVKEERKDEREKEYEARLDAHAFNQELGQQLFERVNEVELTNDVADLIVALALSDDAVDAALRGYKYIHPALVEEEELKNGKTKLTFVEGHEDMRERLTSFVQTASTPGEKVARVVQLALAAELADHEVVARSRRGGHQFHAGGQAAPAGNAERFESALEAMFKRLTPKMRENALARRTERKKGGSWNA